MMLKNKSINRFFEYMNIMHGAHNIHRLVLSLFRYLMLECFWSAWNVSGAFQMSIVSSLEMSHSIDGC